MDGFHHALQQNLSNAVSCCRHCLGNKWHSDVIKFLGRVTNILYTTVTLNIAMPEIDLTNELGEKEKKNSTKR